MVNSWYQFSAGAVGKNEGTQQRAGAYYADSCEKAAEHLHNPAAFALPNPDLARTDRRPPVGHPKLEQFDVRRQAA